MPRTGLTQQHMEVLRSQMEGLVAEAILERKLPRADAKEMAKVIRESLAAFHHPRLVAQYIGEERGALLSHVLENVLRGLRLRA